MSEVEYSPTVEAAAQVAGIEAINTKRKEISPGLMLIALCKLDPVHLDERAKAECSGFYRFLSSCNIDRVNLRNKIGQLEGQGDYAPSPGKTIPLSPKCTEVFKHAKRLAQDYKQSVADPYTLLLAMVQTKDPTLKKAFDSLEIGIDALRQAVIDQVQKPALPKPKAPPVVEEVEHAPTPVLDKLGIDLTQQAKEGEISPIINRKEELRQILLTLMRKQKNNPILIGEAGVGKSVIVEGLAYRIAEGNIVPFLKNRRIVQLPISSIRGAGGDPIGRLREIIDEVKNAPDVIIFIDEIHTIVEQGVSIRYGFADVLKPALARGKFPLIGATTTEEYRKYFQEDEAFRRRFEPITVSEPGPEVTHKILEAAKKPWEETRYVHVSPEAIKAAIDLTTRYMPSQRLPDKAKSVLEDACNKVHGGDKDFSLTPGRLTGPGNIGEVTENSVAGIVGRRIGRDITKEISKAERERLATMAETIKRRVIGQDKAVDTVAQAVTRARTGLKEPKRPIGVFLFAGPSGVGKTQLAKSLAQFLFHSEDALTRLDMGQYQSEWTVSQLQGSPLGYVGYDKGGDLTNALLDQPYSVVLLDEIEKAHPKVFDIFLSLFDEGRLEDNHFRVADGRNTVFIMTSNVGSELYGEKVQIGPTPSGARRGEVAQTESEFMKRLRGRFRPEFIGRVDEIVMFNPLTRENTVEIARIMAGELAERMVEQGVSLEFDDSAIHLLAEKGLSPAYGARELQNVLRRMVTTPLSEELLHSQVEPGDKVVVKAEEGRFTFQTQKGTPETTLAEQ